ncbi:MAG: 3-hydroxyacyl-CoA dehydrogenase NAD-binding domain-containing protein [Pseudomonadota bacterium]
MSIHYSRDGDIAILAADNPPVNALGQAVRQGLADGLARAVAEGARALVVYGEGRTWFAGADIREFGKPPVAPFLPDVCAQFEAAPIPVIAAMHGTVLGGGLEVALSCHYRIALPDTRLGLPEVTLGLIPGAGGTQRLPRLTGVDRAIAMITSGRPIDAGEARAAGLLDQVSARAPRDLGLAYARALLAKEAPPRPVSALPTPEPVDFEAARAAVAKKARGQRSPIAALEAIEAATTLPFAEGLAQERAIFQSLMQTDQRKGLIHAFFAEREAPKLPELQNVAPREVAALGIVGGGTMGAGIATAVLLAGLPVHLLEMSDEAADAARSRITANLDGALKRGKISDGEHQQMRDTALTVGTDDGALSTADLIIEAVFEDMAVKEQVFARLDAVAKQGAILATNTSYLDVDAIARFTARPEAVLGLHFFSPAHVMRLLEVVVGAATAPETVATGFALAKRLKKVAVRAGVCDGFIGNRILQHYRKAADHMVLDGASPYAVDAALEGFGFAMGPFAMGDLAGLDIAWANRKRLAPHLEPRERIPSYADWLCEAEQFGQKSGAGFYRYEGRARSENPEALALIDKDRAARGITPRAFEAEEIVARYMAAMVNEAARVVGEGIARRPLDADVALLFGYGFPRYHGGPLKYADLQGLGTILDRIHIYAEDDAYFWASAPLLEQLVRDGKSFDDLNKS